MIVNAWDSLTEGNLRNTTKKLLSLPEEPEVADESVNSEKNDLDEFVDLFGNDHEIISSIKNQDDDRDNDSSSDNSVDAPNKPSHAETFAAFETGLE
ncbi:hypothetical protein PV326_012829 [Microctonus aethiopoides]|nr:hypothetical protein PV326_012829 [Microctonus aethiopoides]